MDPEDLLPILNQRATKHLERVQSLVKYCPICQPYESGDYIWILGEKTSLDDIFYEMNVPERYWDDISAHIYCSNCGAQNFERYSTVGKEDRYIKETIKKVEQAKNKYGSKIDSFQEHITKYSMLGHSHPLGKKIFTEITNGKIPKSNASNTWHRARIVTESKVYECQDLNAPQVGVAKDGRYHHAGQSVLYLSNSKETAISEVLDDYNRPSLIWLQQYEINVNNLLDLQGNWDMIEKTESALIVAILSIRILEREVENRQTNWKPEYFITRYVADCAKLAGFNGIHYNSTRDIGDNVVLFKWEKNSVVPKGDPEIIIHKAQANAFSTIDSFEELF